MVTALKGRPSCRANRRERGATMAELAIVLPIIISLVIISLDFLRLSILSAGTQYAVTTALREAIIGPKTRPLIYGNQEDWITGRTIEIGRVLGVTIDPLDISICPFSILSSGGSCAPTAKSAGLPGEIIAVQVNRPAKSFIFGAERLLGPAVYTIRGFSVARNETW